MPIPCLETATSDVENLFEKAQLEFDRLDLLERPYEWRDFANLPKREANLLDRLEQWLRAFQGKPIASYTSKAPCSLL